METAFAEAAIPAPPRDAIRRIVGLSLVEAVGALLPEADDALHRRLAADYKAAFFRLRGSGAMADEPLFEGMIATLDALTEAGWVLGVATGKSDRGLAHVLSHHGIITRFVTLQTADRHPSKPDPAMIMAAMAEAGAAPETTVMIGDTSYDMLMARAAVVLRQRREQEIDRQPRSVRKAGSAEMQQPVGRPPALLVVPPSALKVRAAATLIVPLFASAPVMLRLPPLTASVAPDALVKAPFN
eukprot:gene1318-1755_t